MSEAGLVTGESKPRPSRLNLFAAVIGGLLVLNAALLFTGSGPLPTGVRIIYWQRYNGFLYMLRFWGVLAAPIGIVIWWTAFFRRRRPPMAFVALLLAACSAGICLCTNYTALYASGWVDTIDSITFNGHAYHLVEYAQYDDPTLYYLGECDLTGTQCSFWIIYSIFMYPVQGPSHLLVSSDASGIVVQMGNQIIYSYDGLHGRCIDDKYHDCNSVP